DRVLLLNNDTVVAPDALDRLGAALDAVPTAGIAGPLVLDLGDPRRVLSAGERHLLPLLCVPRTLLRHRRRPQGPFPVGGVMGCAMLVTRACFLGVGGFDEAIGVYYGAVVFCVGAGPRGFGAAFGPAGVASHAGLRGLGGGWPRW